MTELDLVALNKFEKFCTRLALKLGCGVGPEMATVAPSGTAGAASGIEHNHLLTALSVYCICMGLYFYGL